MTFKNLRVRMAPSPTGWLHIGSLRTVIFNVLLAKKHGGTFVLRVEDTDQKRLVKGGIAGIEETLELLGMTPDEGPTVGGEYGPYIQSERLELYKKYAQDLVKKGKAYYCFCSEARLKKLREEQKKNKVPLGYDGKCRDLSESEVQDKIKAGEPYVIRLKVPREGFTEYDDIVYGHVKIKNSSVDDQVLIKQDGFPTYHMAVVIDDHEMKINPVTRADEWMSSTPKHILLYKAFGWEIPGYAHFPMVLNSDGKGKLSKRKSNVAVIDYLRMGYPVDALVNFLVLLGWSPPPDSARQDEIYSRKELVELFSLDRVRKSACRFQTQKLDYFGKEYIKRMKTEDLANQILEWAENVVAKELVYDKVVDLPSWQVKLKKDVSWQLPLWKKDKAKFCEIIELIRPRIKRFDEALHFISPFYKEKLEYDIGHFKTSGVEDKKEMSNILKSVWKRLQSTEGKWLKDKEFFDTTIRDMATENGWQVKTPFTLLRLALLEDKVSCPVWESAVILGPTVCTERVNQAVEFLQS